jgi:hypothetical protein
MKKNKQKSYAEKKKAAFTVSDMETQFETKQAP